MLSSFSGPQRLDAVEQLIPLVAEAGLSMPHLAMAFATSHPGVTSALLGARTGPLDQACVPPSVSRTELRRRPLHERRDD